MQVQDGEYDKEGCEFEEDEDMAEAEGEEDGLPAAAPPAAGQVPEKVGSVSTQVSCASV